MSFSAYFHNLGGSQPSTTSIRTEETVVPNDLPKIDEHIRLLNHYLFSIIAEINITPSSTSSTTKQEFTDTARVVSSLLSILRTRRNKIHGHAICLDFFEQRLSGTMSLTAEHITHNKLLAKYQKGWTALVQLHEEQTVHENVYAELLTAAEGVAEEKMGEYGGMAGQGAVFAKKNYAFDAQLGGAANEGGNLEMFEDLSSDRTDSNYAHNRDLLEPGDPAALPGGFVAVEIPKHDRLGGDALSGESDENASNSGRGSAGGVGKGRDDVVLSPLSDGEMDRIEFGPSMLAGNSIGGGGGGVQVGGIEGGDAMDDVVEGEASDDRALEGSTEKE